MKSIFTNLIGSFVLDEKLAIIDSQLFKTIEDFQDKKKTEEKLEKKYQGKDQSQDLQPLPKDKIPQILALFKEKKYFQQFYSQNLALTKQLLKDSVNEDQLIIQTIANVNELERTINLLAKRLREWYSLYLPELSEEISSNEVFVELVASKTKLALLKEIKLQEEESMGANLEKTHVEEMTYLAKEIEGLTQLKEKHETYLQIVMKKYCPNVLALAGVTIGAKLIELGKGLKHLALLPASTIQLLGAEKALFRHIKTGSRSPKHGIIVNHQLVQKAKRNQKGKAARMLADKLSLCARLDFFKGEFKAEEYKQELEKELGQQRNDEKKNKEKIKKKEPSKNERN